MKKLNSTRLGMIEVDEQQKIYFEQGVPGFETYKQFYFVQPKGHDPFSYMQSEEDADLSFIVVNPFLFYDQYQFELSESVKKELEIYKEEDVLVFTFLSVRDSLKEATLNLLAPIVVCLSSKKGKQIALHDSQYHTRHPLLDGSSQAAASRKG